MTGDLQTIVLSADTSLSMQIGGQTVSAAVAAGATEENVRSAVLGMLNSQRTTGAIRGGLAAPFVYDSFENTTIVYPDESSGAGSITTGTAFSGSASLSLPNSKSLIIFRDWISAGLGPFTWGSSAAAVRSAFASAGVEAGVAAGGWTNRTHCLYYYEFEFNNLPGDLPDVPVTFDSLALSSGSGSIATWVDEATGSYDVAVTIGGQTETLTAALMTATARTPSITSITPDSIGSAATTTVFTIVGTQLLEAVSVQIGAEDCEFDTGSATDSKIVCTLSKQFSSGNYSAFVTVALLGKTNSINIVVGTQIAVVSPTAGSTLGFGTITLTGSGFPYNTTATSIDLVSADLSVVVPCVLASAQASKLICSPRPSSPLSTSSITTVTIVRFSGAFNTSLPGSGYDFDPAKTPTVTGLTPTESATQTSILVIGTGFDLSTDTPVVTIGSSSCNVTSLNATAVECTTGDERPGLRAVTVVFPDIGKATGSASLKFIATLSGGGLDLGISLSGGVQLAPNASVVLVKDSTRAECLVLNSTVGYLHCRTPKFTLLGNYTVASVGDADVVCRDGQDPPCYIDVTARFSLTSISPISGSQGDVISITGTFFTGASYNITIGSATCASPSVTDTEITCTLGSGAAGIYGVEVAVGDLGLVPSDPPLNFTYFHTIDNTKTGLLKNDNTYSLTSSINGGASLYIQGTGFGFVKENVTVLVGSNPCPVTSITPTRILCLVPAASAGDVAISVRIAGTTITGPTLSYASPATPSVSAVAPSVAVAGTPITISGSFGNGFVTGDVTVTAGTAPCVVTASADTQIVCTVGTGRAGTGQALKLLIADRGLATVAASAETAVALGFTLSAIVPAVSARSGGALVTLTGTGFDTVATNVTLCGVQCKVSAITPTSVTVLLDVSTPKLSVLLVEGSLIFDDNQDLELNAGENSRI
eukprot:tig00021073_g18015.t1